MQAIRFDDFGEPSEVLYLRDVPIPEPVRGQVRVRMIASPIHPSDLAMVRGRYDVKPSLPATPGFEGVGIVEDGGSSFLGRLWRGRRVAVLNPGGGNWQEQVVVSASHVIPVPDDFSDGEAATLFVNPATVLAMIRSVLRIPRGAWLLQTAASSTLGEMIIRLSKLDGFHTINVVRRPDRVEDLYRSGADAVICTADESIEDRVQKITNGSGVPFALDCVGGDIGSAVARVLTPSGRMLIFGSLSSDLTEVGTKGFRFGSRRIEGFALSQWVSQQSILTRLLLFHRIKKLVKAGALRSELKGTFSLDEIKGAVQRAELPGKPGKVILRISPP